VPPGSCVPLRAEFLWLQLRIEAMRDAIHNHRPVTEDAFREAQAFVRAVRRKAEQMGMNHPEYLAASEEIARVFMGAQALSGVDLPTVGRLLQVLGKLTKAAEQAVGARDVRVHGLAHTTVWAGRDILIQEKAGASTLYAGRDVRSPETTVLSQCDIVAAGEVALGVLNSVRGNSPVTVRAGGRMQVGEVQAGCAFEFGAERREFKSDLQAVLAGTNAKGQLIIKHQE
jgi:hypothetical protein